MEIFLVILSVRNELVQSITEVASNTEVKNYREQISS